jgi:hypothetical protein
MDWTSTDTGWVTEASDLGWGRMVGAITAPCCGTLHRAYALDPQWDRDGDITCWTVRCCGARLTILND